MTEQEEKAIAAFDEGYKGPFEVMPSTTDRRLRAIYDADMAMITVDYNHTIINAICAILNNRAEQKEQIRQVLNDSGDVVGMLRERIDRLIDDKAELVDGLQILLRYCSTATKYHRVDAQALITKHEVK